MKIKHLTMFGSDESNVDVMLGDPRKALIKLSIPLIISLLIANLYNIIDAFWVSGLGADALAGVGFVTPIFMILVGLGNGLASGAAFAISKYIGENNKSKADNASIHLILITILISIITTIILLIFLKPILIMMGAGRTINFAVDYGQIILVSAVFIILSNSLQGIFRGEGTTSKVMYAMIASSILNIVLDPIFIYILNLGVRGAAYATVITSVFVILIMCYWFYIKKDSYLKPNWNNYAPSKEITADIVKVGIPASLQLINNAFFAAVFSALLAFISSTDSVAVYSTGWRVVVIGTTPILAIGTALISVIAVNYGARNFENIKIAHRYAMKISMIFAVAVMIITFIFAGDIAYMFSYSADAVRISAELTSFLQWIVLYYPSMAVGVASTYVFQGVGKGITAMFQTIMRETGFTLAFALIFTFVLNLGVWGAWMGIVLGEIVSNSITLIWSDLYIKKLIKINKSN